jgi:hypothetical protein
MQVVIGTYYYKAISLVKVYFRMRIRMMDLSDSTIGYVSSAGSVQINFKQGYMIDSSTSPILTTGSTLSTRLA